MELKEQCDAYLDYREQSWGTYCLFNDGSVWIAMIDFMQVVKHILNLTFLRFGGLFGLCISPWKDVFYCRP